MNVYTSGDWQVTPGREEDFVREWRLFAQAAVRDIDHTVQGTLLRDSEKQGHFISFGSWPSREVIDRWRNSDVYRTHFSRLEALTDSRRMTTYEVAAQTELMQVATM